MMNNYLALIITFILAVAWLRINDYAAHRGWVESRLSRKLIHIGTGPIFVLSWLLFSPSPSARWLAALVPFAITTQFILVGLGVIKDDAAVRAMSRSGDRREILKGPLYYGIVFVVVTILFWKDSPIGIVALMVVCGGDGLAEVLGRRFGKTALPWSRDKTWLGSSGMFFGSWLMAVFVLAIYVWFGVFPTPFTAYIMPISIIVLGATIVESLPVKDIDNITISVTSIILGFIFWQ